MFCLIILVCQLLTTTITAPIYHNTSDPSFVPVISLHNNYYIDICDDCHVTTYATYANYVDDVDCDSVECDDEESSAFGDYDQSPMSTHNYKFSATTDYNRNSQSE